MRALLKVVAVSLLLFPPAALLGAQPARLVRDFTPGPADSLNERSWLRSVGDLFFFGKKQDQQGEVIWRSDGTPDGTYPVHHFARALGGYSPPEVSALSRNRLLFWAGLGSGDGEPWISDGSVAGTYELELCPGPCRPRTRAPVEVAGRLLFIGWSPAEGFELRSTDGAAGIANPLLPLLPGPEDGVSPEGQTLKVLGPQALFFGRSSSERQHATELWVTDGTSVRTRRLWDPGEGVASFVSGSLPGLAFFRFQPEGGDDALWVTDGTRRGTRRLASLMEEPAAALAIPLGEGDMAFLVYRFDEESNYSWEELWKTDGTSQGTGRLVKFQEFYAGSQRPFRKLVEPLYRFGGRVFFGFSQDGHQPQLWSSDGTIAGTGLVPTSAAESATCYPNAMITVGGRLLLLASDDGDYDGLWALSAAGELELLMEAEFRHSLLNLGAFKEGAVFLAEGSRGNEVWTTDGTQAGTRRLWEIRRGAASSEARFLLRHGEGLFFASGDEYSENLLWRTDGTDSGSSAVDLDPDTRAPQLLQLASDGRQVLALAADGLYRSDGTARGSERLFAAVGDTFSLRGREVYFAADDATTGQEPWVGDLDTGHARLLRDINPGFETAANGTREPRKSWPDHFTTFAHHTYFIAYSGRLGTELWRSNGKRLGTVPLETVAGQASDLFNPSTLVPSEERIFLVSDHGVWATGPPPASLHEAFRTRQGFGIYRGTAFRRRLFFAEAPTTNYNSPITAPATLWSSDGTAAGTREILRGDLPWATPQELTAAGLTLYFSAMTAEHGWELWATDGTAQGTRLVKDIAPGPASSNPRDLRAVAGRLLFSADDGLHGQEPWASDGTEDGTYLLADVDEGALASFPREFTSLGDEVLFSGQRSDVGREIFAVARPELDSRCRPTERRLCLQNGRIGVEVDWRNPRTGEIGVGHAEAFSNSTGTFWFFDQANVELLVKALDGRVRNDSFWFFSGGLSDVLYWVTATDFETGRTRTFHNPAGNLCGQADLTTFGDREVQPTATVPQRSVSQFSRSDLAAVAAPGEACPALPGALLLQDGRFAVQVEWQIERSGGRQGSGTAVPATDKSGYFWFFGPKNLELAIKVLDGRLNNGHFWVLWGALSDVAYQIQVTDLETCQQRTYTNPEGNLCGGADSQAF